MENLADDPSFIDAIVHEVKSQGLFDQFRKECLADVDTKPAYQNLRQRVESFVSKFLSQQKWNDNIRHKNQLREKLRRNIIESGFLDTGVERIVDQVVNPKISTVFHPKVEEIVYNYLGIEKPKPIVNGSGGLDVQTDFLPEDLEAVSPDSDKKSSSASSDLHPTVEHNAHEELNESKEHIDDFESPAFEPLEMRPPSQTKHESNDSNASAISGLTSQESVENEANEVHGGASGSAPPAEPNADAHMNGNAEQPVSTEDAVSSPMKGSPEIAQNDSQLSQVSSNSRLSIITSSEGVAQQHQQQQQQQESQQDIMADPRLDITEEAQMPNFHENSNEEEGELADSNDDDAGVSCELEPQKSNFDLRQEAYDFKGTERSRYVAAEMEGYDKERSPEGQDAVVEGGSAKERTLNVSDEHQQYTTSPVEPARYDENSSHSERSLRICEDSTLEQRVLNTSDQLENCDSAKTPLNDEHSTESAPDVDKMDASQVEVVSLAAVQHHSPDKESKKDRYRGRERLRDHKHSSSHRHGSSSSRDDRRSHGSSKHSSSSSSRKSDHRDRRHENGNSSSNNGSSRKSHDKRKDEDDHYSAHEKPTKRRRSTDRDSNDGAENGKQAKPSGDSTGRSGESVNDSGKDTQGSDKCTGGGGGTQDKQDKLNDSLDSSFEGFDEDQLHDDPKKMEKMTKALVKSSDKAKSRESAKVPKKTKKLSHKSPKETDRKAVTSMDVFAFSFEKPSKLGKNGEICHDEVPLPCSESEDKGDEVLPTSDSIDQLEEGVIVLEPTELAKVIEANEKQTLEEETSCMDDEILKTAPYNFPQANPDDLVTLATQPVVVDQMLTNGDNMDLELLIGEKRLCGDETTLDKIQQGLDVVKNKVRKPKIASNFNEARKLMKVRRQIERDEKKKQEQAMVLAKRLITENGNASENDQGIELEFVCDGNRISSGPIISSPVRQKAKLNSSFEEEPDLLFLPEDGQVYEMNENLLNFLKQNNISVPDDFIRSNNRLYSLEFEETSPKEISARNVFPKIENDETMVVEVLEPSFCSTPAKLNQSGNLDDVGSKSPKLSNSRAISIDSDHNVKHDTTKGVEKGKSPEKPTKGSPEDSPSESNVDFDKCISSNLITKESSATDVHSATQPATGIVEPAKENARTSIRNSKKRRLGLPKPKVPILHNSSTAILTVDISDVKAIGEEKESPGNNNNGIIKAQRYSSNDLYKPRALSSRTRTRASEQVGI